MDKQPEAKVCFNDPPHVEIRKLRKEIAKLKAATGVSEKDYNTMKNLVGATAIREMVKETGIGFMSCGCVLKVEDYADKLEQG